MSLLTIEELSYEEIRTNLEENLEVLRSRWAPAVLFELVRHDRPQRRKALIGTVTDKGERIAEGVLSEVLARLLEKQYVVKNFQSRTDVSYEATAKARSWIAWLLDVVKVTARVGREREMAAVTSPGTESSAGLDLSKPSSARVWNYFLGGKDNFPVDRQIGDQVRAVFPAIVDVAREQRDLLDRVVTYLVVECNIRQFLDIGTGLPTASSTHEVAQSRASQSRVVYVDNDPLVLAHARALLTSSPEGATDYIDSDVQDPEKILRQAAHTLDFSKPVGLIMLGIIGNVADYAEARRIVERLVDAVPAGSYLALCDGTSTSAEQIEAQRVANQGGHPYNLRTPHEITGFFHGLDLVEPGVVPISRWRPGAEELPPPVDCYCGVARKR